MASASKHREWSVESILDALANAPEHIVPEDALNAAHDHQEALIPHLQAAVDIAYALSADGRLQSEGDWRLHSFALHLLAFWRVPGTYDRIWSGLTLEDCYDSRWLMSDAYLDWPHLLITTFDGDAERVLRIARQDDPPWNEELRSCSVMVLAAAYQLRLADRAAIEAGFSALLAAFHDNTYLLGVLLDYILRLRIPGLLPEAERLLQTPIGKKALCKIDAQAARESSWCADFDSFSIDPTPIVRPQDLLTIISRWFYFQPPVRIPKVSDPLWLEMLAHEKHIRDTTSRPGPCILQKRTLPCDCGSGLPYGSCCGQK